MKPITEFCWHESLQIYLKAADPPFTQLWQHLVRQWLAEVEDAT